MGIDELIRKAESGDPIAQYELSKKYSDGDEVEKNYDKALYWAESRRYKFVRLLL